MDPALIKVVSTTAAVAYGKFQQKERTIHLCDPLSTLLKVGLLTVYPPQTKIAFMDNKIILQKADGTQALRRWYRHDSHDDLYHLKMPILFLVGLKNGFLTLDHAPSSPTEETVQSTLLPEYLEQLYGLVLDGLTELSHTYESLHQSQAVRLIQDLVSLLQRPYTRKDFLFEIDGFNMSLFLEFTRGWTNETLGHIFKTWSDLHSSVTDTVIRENYVKCLRYLIAAQESEILGRYQM